MKKVFVLGMAAGLLLASCGGNDSGSNNSGNAQGGNETTAQTAEEKRDPEVEKGESLVAQSGCFACHQISQPATGPAYEAVAAKYDFNETVMDTLSDKIVKGGVGAWGVVPMPPNAHVKKEDALVMLTYIKSLKK